MVYKCSIPFCRSEKGMKNQRISYHKFPLSNRILMKRWTMKIPRHLKVTKYSRICSDHFQASCFKVVHSDSNKWRRAGNMNKKVLKEDAFPTIFPKSNSANNLHAEEVIRRNFTFATLQTLLLGLQSAHLLDAYYVKSDKEQLIIMHIDISCVPPKLVSTVNIFADLTFIAYKNNRKVLPRELNEMIDSTRLIHLSDATVLFKYLSDGNTDDGESPLKQIRDLVKYHVSNSNLDENALKLCCFMDEQMKLVELPKCGRRFTSSLIVLCLLISKSSAASYRILSKQSGLCLPSPKTLYNVTKVLKSPASITDNLYLQERCKSLTFLERQVTLMFDEVYISAKTLYSNGEFIGLTEDGVTNATTVLCFFVKSIFCKYRDMVALFPIAGISVKKIQSAYERVMLALTAVDLHVVLISCDNHSVNRTFIKNYLMVNIKETFIPHPFHVGKSVYVIIDPTHTIKNVYNNFQRRRLFKMPAFPGEHENPFNASFDHIEQLYNLELCKPLRMAHKLRYACLYPTNIQRCNVSLCLSVFDDSTVNALLYYVQEHNKPWYGTYLFVKIFTQLWKVLNVKNCKIGIQKRDSYRSVIDNCSHHNLSFINKFSQFLDEWRNNSTHGLSSETFFAIQLVCSTVPALCSYLLCDVGFKYVLPGYFQSDPIEERFSWYRQLNGGNYFLNLKNLFDNEKCIRILSLAKYSSFKFKCNDIPETMNNSSLDYCNGVRVLELQIQRFEIINLDIDEANIVYYVAGYCARHIRTLC